jgi:hypothetical protein
LNFKRLEKPLRRRGEPKRVLITMNWNMPACSYADDIIFFTENIPATIKTQSLYYTLVNRFV